MKAGKCDLHVTPSRLPIVSSPGFSPLCTHFEREILSVIMDAGQLFVKAYFTLANLKYSAHLFSHSSFFAIQYVASAQFVHSLRLNQYLNQNSKLRYIQ